MTEEPEVKPTAYFAHSMRDYGSKVEAEVRAELEKRFKVLCPHRDLAYGGNMTGYFRMIRWCDLTIVLEHKDHVGRGVFEEVRAAFESKKRVLVWRAGKLRPVVGVDVADRNDWKVKYGRLNTGPEPTAGRGQKDT